MDKRLSTDEMMAALYSIHIDNVVVWDDEDVTAYQVIARDKGIEEKYDELVQQYERGRAVLREHLFVATHLFSLSDVNEEFQKLVASIPADCVGFVPLVYPSKGKARFFFFFPRSDLYEIRRTMLYHLIVSMDEKVDMLVLSCPEGSVTLQRLDEKHFCLLDEREAGNHSSFIGYSVQVWAVMWEIENQLHRQFQLTPTLAQKLGSLPEE